MKRYTDPFPQDYKKDIKNVYRASRLAADVTDGKLARYTNLTLLGAGGFGEVHQATDTTLNRPVAIKFLDAGGVEEARVLANLEVPGFVTVFDVIETKTKRSAIVMRRIHAPTLEQVLRAGTERLDLRRACRVMVSFLAALAELHKQNLVHNDLKPGNLFLEDGDAVLISDFGGATKIDGQLGPHTPAYTAPELLPRGGPVSIKTDLYSAACIAYELFTGKLCHPKGMHDGGFVNPESLRPELPQTIEQALKLALRRDSNDRPASAKAFAEPFQDYLDRTKPADPKQKHRLGALRSPCYGRDTELDAEARTVADFTAPGPRSCLYHGLGGIGKSTFALAVAHHPLVAQAFQDERYQVTLDGVISADGLAAKVASAVGAEVGGLEDALDIKTARLLLLDTVDDPLAADGVGVNELLQRWGGYKSLTLVMTSRPDRHPTGNWHRKVPVRPLPLTGIRETFLFHSGGRHVADPQLPDVLALAVGIPIMAKVLGYQSTFFDNLNGFLQEWNAPGRPTVVAVRRQDSMIQCVQFSLNRRQLQENEPARRLLRLLADLPDGLFVDDLPGLLPDEHQRALYGLREIGGLADEDSKAKRLTMLAPIRDQLRQLLPKNDDDWRKTIQYFATWAAAKGKDFRWKHDTDARARFQATQQNLELLLRNGLMLKIKETIGGVQGLADFAYRLGMDCQAFLETAAALAKELGEDRNAALIFGQIADVLQDRGQTDEALRIRREEQLPVYERLGDVRAKAMTMGQIADVLQQRGQTDEALRIRREEQLPVYERLGDVRAKAITMGRIADVLQQRGQTDEALRIRREEELPVYERLGDVRLKAITMGQIADVLQDRGQTDEALRIRREEELPVYERLGDVRLKAVTMGMIADVLQDRGQTDEALRIRWEEELPVYERLGDVRSKAVTMGKIADVLQDRGQTDEALRIRREEELPVYERLGDVRSKAVTMGQIADVLQDRGQTDEALRIRREEELPVYERLGDVRAKAMTMGRIADVLQDRGQTDEALRIRWEEELPVYERLGDVRSKAVTMGKIADVLQDRGQTDEALRIRREEELPVYERLGDVRSKAVTMGKIADVLQDRGQTDEALRIRREEELPVYERLGLLREMIICRTKISKNLKMRLSPKDWAEARAHLEWALTEARKLGLLEAEVIEGLLDTLDGL